MNHNHAINAGFQQGASLIEVLVATFVMAIGFLSMLALQMQNLSDVSESNRRYVAQILAQDMGERIRANSERASDYNMTDWGAKGADCDSICESDMNEWLASIKDDGNNGVNALLSGQGKVSVNATTLLATVEIRWKEKDNASFQTYSLEVPVNDRNSTSS